MKSDLYIRTDGSSEIGLGHLVRCISLSTYVSDQFSITFVCREIPQKIEDELNQQGISLLKIHDEGEFFNLPKPNSIVVLDGYSFDTAYQKRIKEMGCRLVCIDDLHDKKFYADLIINHAPGIKKSDYSAQPGTIYALGLDYALLRPPFLEVARKAQLSGPDKIETILICFGGSDSENLTLRTLNVVLDFNPFKKIIIITGSAYGFMEELLQKIKNRENVVHYHALDGDEMAAAFTESEAAIIPSSGILFEALATGNIAISGTYTENQKEVYVGFNKLGAIIDAGEFREREIRNAIQQIGSYTNQKKFIDGKSPDRIRTLFQTI